MLYLQKLKKKKKNQVHVGPPFLNKAHFDFGPGLGGRVIF